jgi:hypothetical protein
MIAEGKKVSFCTASSEGGDNPLEMFLYYSDLEKTDIKVEDGEIIGDE